MTTETRKLYEHLMADPDFIPPDGLPKEEMAWTEASQRIQQTHNNQRALELALDTEPTSAVAKLKSFTKNLQLQKASSFGKGGKEYLENLGYSSSYIAGLLNDYSENEMPRAAVTSIIDNKLPSYEDSQFKVNLEEWMSAQPGSGDEGSPMLAFAEKAKAAYEEDPKSEDTKATSNVISAQLNPTRATPNEQAILDSKSSEGHLQYNGNTSKNNHDLKTGRIVRDTADNLYVVDRVNGYMTSLEGINEDGSRRSEGDKAINTDSSSPEFDKNNLYYPHRIGELDNRNDLLAARRGTQGSMDINTSPTTKAPVDKKPPVSKPAKKDGNKISAPVRSYLKNVQGLTTSQINERLKNGDFHSGDTAKSLSKIREAFDNDTTSTSEARAEADAASDEGSTESGWTANDMEALWDAHEKGAKPEQFTDNEWDDIRGELTDYAENPGWDTDAEGTEARNTFTAAVLQDMQPKSNFKITGSLDPETPVGRGKDSPEAAEEQAQAIAERPATRFTEVGDDTSDMEEIDDWITSAIEGLVSTNSTLSSEAISRATMKRQGELFDKHNDNYQAIVDELTPLVQAEREKNPRFMMEKTKRGADVDRVKAPELPAGAISDSAAVDKAPVEADSVTDESKTLDIDKLYAAMEDNPGGFTLNPDGSFAEVQDGRRYMVSPDKSSEKTYNTMPEKKHVQAYYDSNAATVASADRYFGGWKGADGKLYLDIPQAFSDFDEAKKIGNANEQQSLFDIDFDNGGGKETLLNLGMALHIAKHSFAANVEGDVGSKAWKKALTPSKRAEFEALLAKDENALIEVINGDETMRKGLGEDTLLPNYNPTTQETAEAPRTSDNTTPAAKGSVNEENDGDDRTTAGEAPGTNVPEEGEATVPVISDPPAMSANATKHLRTALGNEEFDRRAAAGEFEGVTNITHAKRHLIDKPLTPATEAPVEEEEAVEESEEETEEAPVEGETTDDPSSTPEEAPAPSNEAPAAETSSAEEHSMEKHNKWAQAFFGDNWENEIATDADSKALYDSMHKLPARELDKKLGVLESKRISALEDKVSQARQKKQDKPEIDKHIEEIVARRHFDGDTDKAREHLEGETQNTEVQDTLNELNDKSLGELQKQLPKEKTEQAKRQKAADAEAKDAETKNTAKENREENEVKYIADTHFDGDMDEARDAMRDQPGDQSAEVKSTLEQLANISDTDLHAHTNKPKKLSDLAKEAKEAKRAKAAAATQELHSIASLPDDASSAEATEHYRKAATHMHENPDLYFDKNTNEPATTPQAKQLWNKVNAIIKDASDHGADGKQIKHEMAQAQEGGYKFGSEEHNEHSKFLNDHKKAAQEHYERLVHTSDGQEARNQAFAEHQSSRLAFDENGQPTKSVHRKNGKDIEAGPTEHPNGLPDKKHPHKLGQDSLNGGPLEPEMHIQSDTEKADERIKMGLPPEGSLPPKNIKDAQWDKDAHRWVSPGHISDIQGGLKDGEAMYMPHGPHAGTDAASADEGQPGVVVTRDGIHNVHPMDMEAALGGHNAPGGSEIEGASSGDSTMSAENLRAHGLGAALSSNKIHDADGKPINRIMMSDSEKRYAGLPPALEKPAPTSAYGKAMAGAKAKGKNLGSAISRTKLFQDFMADAKRIAGETMTEMSETLGTEHSIIPGAQAAQRKLGAKLKAGDTYMGHKARQKLRADKKSNTDSAKGMAAAAKSSARQQLVMERVKTESEFRKD